MALVTLCDALASLTKGGYFHVFELGKTLISEFSRCFPYCLIQHDVFSLLFFFSDNSDSFQEPAETGNGGEFKCDECPKSFQWKANLQRHQVGRGTYYMEERKKMKEEGR